MGESAMGKFIVTIVTAAFGVFAAAAILAIAIK